MGLDHIMLFEKSVDNFKFKIFLDELRAKYFYDDICLYLDNLSVHRSKVVKERMEELGIACIYGPSYGAEYNGVEYVFSIAKHKVK